MTSKSKSASFPILAGLFALLLAPAAFGAVGGVVSGTPVRNVTLDSNGKILTPTNFYLANASGLLNGNSIFRDDWTPIADDTNVVGWWRSYAGVTADASSNVTHVADGSGYGRGMVQITAGDFPFLLTNGLAGGKSSIAFDGSADWLYATNFNFEQPATLYLLYKQSTWVDGRQIFSGQQGGKARVYQSASSPLVFQRSGTDIGAGYNRQDVGVWGHLITVWSNSASKISFNGMHQGGGNPGTGGFGGLTIAGSDVGALNAKIEFGELVARAGIDGEDVILKHNRYFQRAQNLPFNLICFDGNSLTEGAGVAPSDLFPSQVITNYLPTSANYFKKVVAVGGDTTSNMLRRARSTDRYYHPRHTTNILCAWEVSNELAFGFGTNVAYANYTNYCRQRQLTGWKVLAFTVISRTNSGANFNSERAAVNSLIRSNYLSFADAIVDVGTNGFLGCDLCGETNTYFVAGGTHLTAAGHTIVATAVTNAIAKLQQ
jgi:lysophospholipase L1-like esterase